MGLMMFNYGWRQYFSKQPELESYYGAKLGKVLKEADDWRGITVSIMGFLVPTGEIGVWHISGNPPIKMRELHFTQGMNLV